MTVNVNVVISAAIFPSDASAQNKDGALSISPTRATIVIIASEPLPYLEQAVAISSHPLKVCKHSSGTSGEKNPAKVRILLMCTHPLPASQPQDL